MKQRELVKKLKKLGYVFERHGSNHDIYAKGDKKIPVPWHTEINERLAMSILEQAGLK